MALPHKLVIYHKTKLICHAIGVFTIK